MLNPRPFDTGLTLVCNLVRYTLATTRLHREEEIHTVLLHGDGRCSNATTRHRFRSTSNAPAIVTLQTARGYVSPPRLLGLHQDWTQADLLVSELRTPRSPKGTVPMRTRLTTFHFWRQHSPLPDLYREIVRTSERERAGTFTNQETAERILATERRAEPRT